MAVLRAPARVVGPPLQLAIFVHIFPIGAGGLEGPLTHDQKGMILDYAWDQFYGQRINRVFRWEGLPLLVTGFEMGFADARKVQKVQ